MSEETVRTGREEYLELPAEALDHISGGQMEHEAKSNEEQAHK